MFEPNTSAVARLPLVVSIEHFVGTRHYYFWFFGYVAKLPYERELTLQQQIDRMAASNAKLREEIRAGKEAISRETGDGRRFPLRGNGWFPSVEIALVAGLCSALNGDARDLGS